MSEYKCVSRAPADCTWNCSDGPCDCSGVYVDACGRKEEVEQLRAIIQAVIGVIDNWKVPLLDPDGKDSSEAVMRLLADDLRKALSNE